MQTANEDAHPAWEFVLPLISLRVAAMSDANFYISVVCVQGSGTAHRHVGWAANHALEGRTLVRHM